jgi:chromosomal replication initiator protein
MTRDFPYEKFLNNKTNKNEDLLNNIFNEKPLNSREIHSANAALSVKDSVDNSVDSCAEISAFKPIEDALFSLLSAQIDQLKFTTFIENKIKLVSFSNNLAKFKAQTSFIQTTIENSFKVQIENCLETLMGEKYSLVFEERDGETLPPVPALKGSLSDLLENNQKSAPMPTSSSTKSSMQKKTSFTLDLTPTKEELTEGIESKFIDHMTSESLGFAIDPNKTFDNFIVGPSNNLAFATACAVSDSPGKTGKYPCLYLYSDSGLGKTHLLHAVANGIFENHTDLSVCLISARDFMKELINAYKDKKLSEFQKKYTESVDVLMIDDIHELKNKNSTQEEFFHIFNFLHDKGKQLIFTSDKSPDKITGIEERIITRLQWGLVVDIQKPDFETRTAILKKKAISLDLFIQDDVLNMIASSIKTSIRELEGSLILLQAHAELMEAEIDVEMARDILKLKDIRDRPAATLESVCKQASQHFKIPVADLRSKSRSKEIVRARHIAWHLSKNIVGATFKEIAQYYSNRDHSSVIHGVNKISQQSKTDQTLAKDVLFLENTI